MTAFYELSLAQARLALQKGEITPLEALEASLGRIRATEPALNACLTVCEDEARRTVKALAGDSAALRAQKPLWGVPVTVKDVFCTKGVRTTCASRMLENFVPPYDAFVIRRLKEAGAVIVAKTNMDEFAMGSSTEFSAFGPSRNPWDHTRVPGGSSGGSAASVAACQAFGSLGSDTGGSIRQPAALCGCVGLKPTYGRVSRYGAVAYASSFDQVGPLARTVEDTAILLGVISGYDPRDATSSTLPAPDFAALLAEEKRDGLKGLVLGVPHEYLHSEDGSPMLSPECEESFKNAVRTARSLGAEVRDISLPHLHFGVAAYYIMTCAEAGTNLARFDGLRYGLTKGRDKGLIETYVESRSAGFGDEVKRRILLGTYALSAGYYDAYYTKAARIRRLIADDYSRALTECDALLAPSSPMTAWTFGSFDNDPLGAYRMDILTLSLNLAGLPGLALPTGLGAQSGLPVGMQIIGRHFDEALILSVGQALEGALPSIGRPT